MGHPVPSHPDTAVARCHTICSKEVAAPCCQRNWICITVGLVRSIGRPCRRTRVDREARTSIGDAVVGQHCCGTQCGRNVIRATEYCLTCGTAVARCHVVGRKEAASAASRQRTGIGVTVGLAGRIGSPCRRTRVDREARTSISNAVVGQHPAGLSVAVM